MSANTWRYEPDDSRPSPAVYWRRRLVALLTGLTVLGAIAWAFSGVAGGSTGTSAADAGPAAHRPSAGAGTGASAGTAAPGLAGSDRPSPSAAGNGPSEAYSAGPGSRHAAVAGSGQPAGPPACAPADVVLSVFASQDYYGPGQPPEFDVDVVSTADGTCAFNIGPRYLELVIAVGGKRLWASADCAAAPGSLVTSLARGVPAMLAVTWDLQTSAPRCSGRPQEAAAGEYTAAASGGGVTSNPVPFQLS